MKECLECEDKVKTLYPDPRRPPLDQDPCLCLECVQLATREAVDALTDEIDDLEDNLTEYLTEANKEKQNV